MDRREEDERLEDLRRIGEELEKRGDQA